MISPLLRKPRTTARRPGPTAKTDPAGPAVRHGLPAQVAWIATAALALPLLLNARGAAQQAPGRQTTRPAPQFAPPVHLVPGSAIPQPARRHRAPIADGSNRPPTGAAVVPAGGSLNLQDQFDLLEQDLSSEPPVERIGQTPARPETRPASAFPQQPVVEPRSVLEPGQMPPDYRGRPAASSVYDRGPALIAPDDELVPLPGEHAAIQRNHPGPPASPAASRLPGSSWRQDDETAATRSQDPRRRRPDDPQRRSADKDCEEYRQKLLNDPIQRIALDISPPRNPRGEPMPAESRDWNDANGNPLCFGRLVDLRRGYAIVETDTGTRRLAVGNLSEADLAAISRIWQIPTTCLVSTGYFAGRHWEPQTATWHASNLCHKPLYFEEVALERYGHSDGPILQPLRSTGHFFISLLTLPYQTGIHPPNECIYALGYYRPGNCAPWLVYPIPISREGAVRQAGVMIAGAYTIF